MTDDKARDELLERAMSTMSPVAFSKAWDDQSHWPKRERLAGEFAAALVDAGWRPPPSGDVIEQAVEVLYQATALLAARSREQAFEAYWRTKAQALADAGLLATPAHRPVRSCDTCKDGVPCGDLAIHCVTPAQQDEPIHKVIIEAQDLDGRNQVSTCDCPIGRDHAWDEQIGETMAQEWLSIPWPPDDATVERVARAIHSIDKRKAQEDYGVTLKDWGLDARAVAEFKEYAYAALRALGEPQRDERPGFVGMFRGAPDLSVRAKDIARGREVGNDAD